MHGKASSSARQCVRFSIVLLFACEALAVAGCKPWTIRPINDSGEGQTSSQRTDPAAYVSSIWATKLVPTIITSAVDARTLLSALSSSVDGARQKYGRNVGGDAWYFTVKGEGKVLNVDTSSRSGFLDVSVLPQSPETDVTIQIGPILRGSALRDSSGLISFSSFVNQLDFADVADDLNNKANQTVLASLDRKALVGRTIQFAGAFEMDTASRPLIKSVVPVELAVAKPQ